MTVYDIFFLLGGLGLFLYGISLMSEGLSLVAGPQLKSLLEKLTHNKWIGALLGFVVTAIIQSSTATTVMVIGFIDSSLMTLSQAAGVIMGANAGTTLTGILFTFNIQDIVPFIIFLGTMAMLFMQRKSIRHTGMAILGFGILFLGLQLMSSAMSPLQRSAFIADLFEYTKMPLIGILVGFLVTALIQSSTASIAILLSMVAAGIVTDLHQAIFILYGFNIGTVITVLIASIKGNKASRQAAVVHVLFNVIGALIFTILTILPIGLVSLIQRLSESITMQLVYAHIIFNVTTMLLLLPLAHYIVAAAERLVTKGSEDDSALRLKFIDRGLIHTPAVELTHVLKEINRMFKLVDDNYQLSVSALRNDKEAAEKDHKRRVRNRKTINFLHREIGKHLSRLEGKSLDEDATITVSMSYNIIKFLKRIEDLSKELKAYIKQYLSDEEATDIDTEELKKIIHQVDKILIRTHDLFKNYKYGDEYCRERVREIRRIDKRVADLTFTDEETLLGGITVSRMLSILGRISANAIHITDILEHQKRT